MSAPDDRAPQRDDDREPCRRCAQTGQFITRVENGVPKGPGGVCYRCRGKGYQTAADRRRNDYYDSRIYPTRAGL